MRVEALDSPARAAHAAVGSGMTDASIDQAVAFGGRPPVGLGDRSGPDCSLCSLHPTVGLEDADVAYDFGIAQPESGRHRGSIVEEGRIGQHDRTSIMAAESHPVGPAGRAPEQLSDRLIVTG